MGMITAHSGCDGTPDNSIEFVRYALTSDADCLEVDVRWDKDKNLVLSHDEAGSENTLLKDAFSLLSQKPNLKINCDLKLQGMEASVYQLAAEFQLEDRLIFSGEVNPDRLLADKEIYFPKAAIFLNIERISPEIEQIKDSDALFAEFQKALAKIRKLPVSCVNLDYHLLTDDILKLMEEMNLSASAWTVNDEADLKWLLQKNIANITTRNLKGALSCKAALL